MSAVDRNPTAEAEAEAEATTGANPAPAAGDAPAPSAEALNGMFRAAIMRMAEAQVAARDPDAPPPAPPKAQRVARAVDAAAFLRAVAPALLLPRADAEFATIELAAAAAARCVDGEGDYVVVHERDRLVLGALRAPIFADPGVLRLCGDPGDGAAVVAALRLADTVAAEPAFALSGVSGPAVLAEAFARQLGFLARTAREPVRTGGLRIWSLRFASLAALAPLAADGACAPLVVTDEIDGAEVALLAAWLEACEAEGGVPADRRTRGMDALGRFAAARGLYVWRVAGVPAAVCGVIGDARSPGGRRIGLVYTPPPLRRRGFASAVARAVAAELLNATDRRGFVAVVTGAPPPGPTGAPTPDPLAGLWERAGFALAGDTADFSFPAEPAAPPAAPAPAGGGL